MVYSIGSKNHECKRINECIININGNCYSYDDLDECFGIVSIVEPKPSLKRKRPNSKMGVSKRQKIVSFLGPIIHNKRQTKYNLQ